MQEGTESTGKRRLRSAGLYALALALPFAYWLLPGAADPQAIRPVAAYIFFVLIALFSFVGGFGVALAAAASSAIALWLHVFSVGPYPPWVEEMRVTMFVLAALVISGTSRQRSQEARAAERRLAALFDSAVDIIVFFDNEGRYIDVNPAACASFGKSRQELIGRHLGDFAPPDERRDVREVLARFAREGRFRGKWRIVRGDGSVGHVEFTAVPDVLPGLHCIIGHDVTAAREAEQTVHVLSARLLKSQDDERRRLARQLHETVAQSLAAIRLNLTRIRRFCANGSAEATETLNDSTTLVEQAISEIRTISYLLHPPMIDEVGLLPTLQWYVRGFAERSGIETTLDAPPPELLDGMADDTKTAVFRIVQEGLTNIQRHSGSSSARISIARKDGQLSLQIADSGHGLPAELHDPAALLAAGVGIAGIHERVRELGGTMKVDSTDAGTTLAVTLPSLEQSLDQPMEQAAESA